MADNTPVYKNILLKNVFIHLLIYYLSSTGFTFAYLTTFYLRQYYPSKIHMLDGRVHSSVSAQCLNRIGTQLWFAKVGVGDRRWPVS